MHRKYESIKDQLYVTFSKEFFQELISYQRSIDVIHLSKNLLKTTINIIYRGVVANQIKVTLLIIQKIDK